MIEPTAPCRRGPDVAQEFIRSTPRENVSIGLGRINRELVEQVETPIPSKGILFTAHGGLKSRPQLGVNLRVFRERMLKRWLSRPNVPSWSLGVTWDQIAQTFNRKLQEVANGHSAKDWHVISPGCGTGKTESAIAYASLFPTFVKGSGMLLVTRLKAAADRLVKEINDEAGEVVAVAHHSDNKLDADVMAAHPVLVITHAAFERAVERTDKGRVWDKLVTFRADKRRDLIVIDEAIDLLEITKLTEDDLGRLVGSIPREARDLWPEATWYLESLLAELRRWVDALQGGDSQTVMRDGDRAEFDRRFGNLPDFAGLRSFMASHRHVGSRRRGTGTEASAELGNSFTKTLDEVESLVRSFVLYAKQGKRTTFNSARMILPDDAQGCVILDATAPVNRFYDVASCDGGFKIHRYAPPPGARSYRNVKLRVARVSATGKGSLAKETEEGDTVGAREAQRMLAWFTTNKDREGISNLFVACHKDNAMHFEGSKVPFPVHVGTYGSTDGSNEYGECSSAVVFGIPWRDRTDASLTFFATQGVQSDEWLKEEARRAFRGFNDIREELYLGWAATDIVQIVNRICIRRVVDAQGNCDPATLYVVLPKGSRGDYILDALLAQLPGLDDVASWDFEMNTAKARKLVRTDYAEKLKSYCRNFETGAKVLAKDARAFIGCSENQWGRLMTSLKEPTSELSLALSTHGVRYAVERIGRTNVGCIVKE